MKQFNMDSSRLKKVLKAVKYRMPRWKRTSWIFKLALTVYILYYGYIWYRAASELIPQGYDFFRLLTDGGMAVVSVGYWLLSGIFLAIIYAIFISESGELLVPAEHIVTLYDNSSNINITMKPEILQIRNVGGDIIETTIPLNSVKALMYNKYLCRLEIYCEAKHSVHRLHVNGGYWEDVENTYFYNSKIGRYVLYDYFYNMKELMIVISEACGKEIQEV